MNEEIRKFRELATFFRAAANAADKVADLLESGDCTDEELDKVQGELAWQLIKIQAIK